jgi:hypothetical protein
MELREAIAYTGPLKSVSDELLSREKKKKKISLKCFLFTFKETFFFTKLKDSFLLKAFYTT